MIEKNVDYTELLEEIALKELKYVKYNCLKMIGKENDKKIYVITNDHTNVLQSVQKLMTIRNLARPLHLCSAIFCSLESSRELVRLRSS